MHLLDRLRHKDIIHYCTASGGLGVYGLHGSLASRYGKIRSTVMVDLERRYVISTRHVFVARGYFRDTTSESNPIHLVYHIHVDQVLQLGTMFTHNNVENLMSRLLKAFNRPDHTAGDNLT